MIEPPGGAIGEADARTPPTKQDYRRVGALALTCIIVLAAVGALRLFAPPSLAPRVNVRWAADVTDAARSEIERDLKLFAGAQEDGRTWAYDVGDPSPEGLAEIVTHPAVEDTHYIDRSRRTISDEARLGTTRIRGGLSVWRDSSVVSWLARLASSFLGVSGVWLVTTGRAAVIRR